MTSEPGEHPLFSVVSGSPSAEELAALTAVGAASWPPAGGPRRRRRPQPLAQPPQRGWTGRRWPVPRCTPAGAPGAAQASQGLRPAPANVDRLTGCATGTAAPDQRHRDGAT